MSRNPGIAHRMRTSPVVEWYCNALASPKFGTAYPCVYGLLRIEIQSLLVAVLKQLGTWQNGWLTRLLPIKIITYALPRSSGVTRPRCSRGGALNIDLGLPGLGRSGPL